MAEVYLDPSLVLNAARDLTAVGRSSVVAIPSGDPWGSDEAGTTFAAAYLPAASAALAAWSSVASGLGRLGDAVLAAAVSTMDSDQAAARRFRS
ncbi:hypothetical protein Ais01nite_41050 [Asanoa ishikariensis]|uniref:Excreted virulence factor EspC, type VII ESX diderm n=1 Tax=Asanoa ishikariensis TaxID=137265 RepID=A0A1H3MEQ1_9ACTN|nr:hypothetical protein [Asanoa ishikariensis]GIF66070.1 hypothetical protein Ais01nite_41050 [Asanoa ishikariensis]SDY74808.1 hypothetical protein SAMN05421684_1343 [Asanoa ishikariensis]